MLFAAVQYAVFRAARVNYYSLKTKGMYSQHLHNTALNTSYSAVENIMLFQCHYLKLAVFTSWQ